MSAASSKVDTVIIGAGVIGLAVARAIRLMGGGKEVLLLDRASYIGSETSSRNSEVIHGGFYYPTNSYKAKFCVEGRQQLYDYCTSRNIYTNRCGKLVVAIDTKQRDTVLRDLYNKAHQNGVSDVQLLSAADVKLMEPSVVANGGALWSPSTGIVDSHAFMQSLLADAENNDTNDSSTTLSLRSNVEDAKIETNTNEIQLCVDGMWLSCTNVVNCAGLWANHIASMMHNNNQHNSNNIHSKNAMWKPPPIYFAKGSYFRLQQQTAPFTHLIYPVPVDGGLGIHATIDSTGRVKFGPDVEWISTDVTTADSIPMEPSMDRAPLFYDAIRTYWPELQDGTLVPDYCGIRPKLSHPSLYGNGTDGTIPFQDFSIVGPQTHGIPGLVHLFGIESPGLTSSMAIADYVAELLS